MKRYGHLFEKIISFENLLSAARKAARGKTDRPGVARFLFHLENELFNLQSELTAGTWQPGGYRVFQINDPKPRLISAAAFRDRVVHHAVCNILEPVFDKKLIFDTWACRKGKGSHAAIRRAQKFSRRYPLVLKCDIRRYFDSVDHGILKQLLRRIIKDAQLLTLLDRIIDNATPEAPVGKGLPIGNLTSQHFANLYLGQLDHYIKERLGLPAYVRYMDDMLLFETGKKELWQQLYKLESFIRDQLALTLKPQATLLAPVAEGIPFLGVRIFPGLIRLQNKSKYRFKRRLKKKEQAYLKGKIDMEELTVSIQSMIAHIDHADTRRYRQSFVETSLPLG